MNQTIEYPLDYVNEVYDSIIDDQHRYILLYGGAGSGKSVFAAQKFLLRLFNSNERHRFLFCRKTARSVRHSQFRLFKELLAQFEELPQYVNVFETDMRFVHVNGNEIITSGLDDTEKLKSVQGITSVWIEEATELDQADFEQINLRLRGSTDGYKQIILTFNPVDENHWLRQRFFPPDEDTTILKTTYTDNKFIDDKYRKVLDFYRKSDPSYWNVYGEGNWGTPKMGHIFTVSGYREYDYLPPDVRGVVYCDPNLSKKGKGDSTAITKLGYSPSTNFYYIIDAVCESFTESQNLLNAVLGMKDDKISALGFDGNVTQESVWSDAVRNWCRMHAIPYPVIDYKRYRVDDIAKNTQLVWNEGRIFFPRGFRDKASNKPYIGQLFAFAGKKAGNPDDAPDSLICAFEFLHERGITRKEEPIFVDHGSSVSSQFKRQSYKF